MNFYMFCRDLQSYLSHLHLFLASESGNFYILVDNRPWLKDLASLSTHWWQLMITKVAEIFLFNYNMCDHVYISLVKN